MIVNILGRANKKLKTLCNQTCNSVMTYLEQPNVELTIKFVSPKEIKKLNGQFRNIDKVTDVLSFPSTELQAGEKIYDNTAINKDKFNSESEIYLGDMAICKKQAARQAKQYNQSIYKEIEKLIIHSCLHLFGYDHILDSDWELMNAKEIAINEYINGKKEL